MGSSILSRSTTTSAKYFAFSSGAKAGFSPELICLILLFAMSIKPFKVFSELSIPLSIIV